jgi:hypothetical protein
MNKNAHDSDSAKLKRLKEKREVLFSVLDALLKEYNEKERAKTETEKSEIRKRMKEIEAQLLRILKIEIEREKKKAQ